MAEAVVSSAVQRIAYLLIQEAVSVHGVRHQVERLQAELKRMQCLLKDADHQQDQDECVRNWVAEIKDLTYDAENIIDTFLLKAARGGEKVFMGEGYSSASEMQQRLRRSYPYDDDEQVISLDANMRDLKDQLMMEEEQVLIVSIVGMGGLGKTTLAKKVCNDSHVKQHFYSYSWTFLS
ncbi:hypothetical protein GH714_036347 [Hevea brasiliensis]|uniref:Rx N-terminal domain-containing protein n=1 Tax=Hevea brasiliensis TaxID=3981 RepID=A0A6A6L6S2_HEVBR|nr:hypothetical protein GH714_036347 [Hevea brasiliensis]